MRFASAAWMIFTIVIAGFMIFGGELWRGLALLGGSVIAFAAGAGTRGSFYRGRQFAGAVVGAVLLLIGLSIVFYSEVFVRLFGLTFSAEWWLLLGAAVGFLGALPEDAA